MTNNTVGVFYERPDGVVVKTVGANSIKNEVTYYREAHGHEVTSFAEWQTWTRRKDLKDFLNPVDPRLPYDFDLHWDIKYLSQLKRFMDSYEDRLLELTKAVSRCVDDYVDVSKLIIVHKIDLNYKQEVKHAKDDDIAGT